MHCAQRKSEDATVNVEHMYNALSEAAARQFIADKHLALLTEREASVEARVAVLAHNVSSLTAERREGSATSVETVKVDSQRAAALEAQVVRAGSSCVHWAALRGCAGPACLGLSLWTAYKFVDTVECSFTALYIYAGVFAVSTRSCFGVAALRCGP